MYNLKFSSYRINDSLSISFPPKVIYFYSTSTITPAYLNWVYRMIIYKSERIILDITFKLWISVFPRFMKNIKEKEKHEK